MHKGTSRRAKQGKQASKPDRVTKHANRSRYSSTGKVANPKETLSIHWPVYHLTRQSRLLGLIFRRMHITNLRAIDVYR